MPQQRKTRAREPHQLPAGRHKLPRQYVEANQRARILNAVADVVSLTGYATMSVEGIIAAAGVSRRTFYDYFNGKEEAFLAALEAACTELTDRVRRAAEASDTFEGGVRDCLATFVQYVVEDLRRAEMVIVEVLAAGPAALQRRNAMMTTLVEMLASAGDRVSETGPPPRLTAETIIGGIYEVAYSRVLQGETHELAELLPDMAYSVMQPYLGHERASQEAGRPAEPVAAASG